MDRTGVCGTPNRGSIPLGAPLRKLQAHNPTAAFGGGQIVWFFGLKNEFTVSQFAKYGSSRCFSEMLSLQSDWERKAD